MLTTRAFLRTILFLRYLHFCPDFSLMQIKRLYKKAKINFKIYDVTDWTTIHILSKSQEVKTIKQ